MNWPSTLPRYCWASPALKEHIQSLSNSVLYGSSFLSSQGLDLPDSGWIVIAANLSATSPAGSGRWGGRCRCLFVQKVRKLIVQNHPFPFTRLLQKGPSHVR